MSWIQFHPTAFAAEKDRERFLISEACLLYTSITRLNYEPCACGRTHVRMEKCMGRTDDMLIIKGVNVFPTQIESVLVGMENVGPHYQLVVRRRNFMDNLEVKVELLNGDLLENYQMCIRDRP